MRPFNTSIFLAITLFSLGSLAFVQELVQIWAALNPDSPEYQKCMNNDCASYLNITSVCRNLARDGNYTLVPDVYERNYLNCTCGESKYLPSLSTCEKCTGESNYTKVKAKCDGSAETTGTATATKTGTTTLHTGTSTSTAPAHTTKAAGSDANMLRGWLAGTPLGRGWLVGSLLGLAAALAGVV